MSNANLLRTVKKEKTTNVGIRLLMVHVGHCPIIADKVTPFCCVNNRKQYYKQ